MKSIVLTRYCTPGQLKLLKEMLAKEQAEEFEDAEILCEGRECWIGFRRTTWKTVNGLLQLCLLKDMSEQGKKCYRYMLNEEGRAMAQDPNYVPMIIEHLKTK